MSRWQFKRFEAMQDSKRRIIENTRKQIQHNTKAKQKNNSFYIATILLTSCLMLFVLLQLIPSDKNATLSNFEGDLLGMIHYENDVFFFQVNEESIKDYPELRGVIRASTKIMFPSSAERVLRDMPELYIDVPAIITIKGLEKIKNAYLAKDTNILDLGTNWAEYEHLFTFQLTLNEQGKLLLDTKLEKIYFQFSQELNKALLINLAPHEVFQLYQFAMEQNDIRVIYELINEESVKPTFEEFSQDIGVLKSSSAFKNTQLYEKIEENHKAYIFTKYKRAFFGLSKTADGIWQVNYLPEQ